MAVAPKSIEVGKCYLAEQRESPQVWQVVAVFPDGRLGYKTRPVNLKARQVWRSAMTTLKHFASMADREVLCDWTPEADEGSR